MDVEAVSRASSGLRWAQWTKRAPLLSGLRHALLLAADTHTTTAHAHNTPPIHAHTDSNGLPSAAGHFTYTALHSLVTNDPPSSPHQVCARDNQPRRVGRWGLGLRI